MSKLSMMLTSPILDTTWVSIGWCVLVMLARALREGVITNNSAKKQLAIKQLLPNGQESLLTDIVFSNIVIYFRTPYYYK